MRVYLDNAATTPLDPEVIKEMVKVMENTFEGLGTAMLSNFKNNLAGVLQGLVYNCNTDTHVNYDIAALGYADTAVHGGISMGYKK